MRRLPLPSRSRQVWLLAMLSCCLLVPLALVACGQQVSVAPGAGATTSPTLTLKQAAETSVAAQATVLANGPHAPKHPVTPPASCPAPTPQPRIVDSVSMPTGGFADSNVDNSTAAAPADAPLYHYVIIAGDRKSNPKQGVLIVLRLLRDPCAATPTPNPNGDNFETFYNTPFQQGHVQMTGVVGDTVTFTTADGGSTVYRFDYVTGQFL